MRAIVAEWNAHRYLVSTIGQLERRLFEIGEQGQICIQYRNGFGRCDTYVRNAGRLVLLTEKGERFPVREVETP